jgi:small multidrug resistance pump
VSFVFLALAIVLEVGGTLSLRMAAHHGWKWIPPVVVGYALAFTMLSLTLQSGMTVGVAYGIWTAVGVALTALAGRILFKEPFTWVMGLGVALIIGGVLLVELGSQH